MKIAENRFLTGLKAGEAQLGIWVSMGSNLAAELVAHAGFDWAVIDMEHCPNTLETVLGQLQAFGGSETTPIVRVPWNDAVMIKQVLDLGAPGLVFPMVQSVEEAKAAVAATRYPPHGIRGFAGSTRATKFGRISDYAARVEDETAVVIQLESRSAIEQAADIAAVDGVTGVFFGPADIAADIGKLGQPMAPEVWDLIMPAAKALIADGVHVGTLVSDADFAVKLLDDGFSMVACGLDTALLASASDALVAKVRGGIK